MRMRIEDDVGNDEGEDEDAAGGCTSEPENGEGYNGAHTKFRGHPQTFPLPSDPPNLHQHSFLPPMARTHANALSTEATQNRMAHQHHKRHVATQMRRRL